KVLAGKREVTNCRKAYGEAEKGEVFLISGSSGYLEISMRGAAAAAALALKPGSPVGVVLL
ncbi:MAG: SAM-dependent chlorinase/fluorinase, partial [Acidobacteriota bacterium]